MGEDQEYIPRSMWMTAFLVASQSFLFGYVFSCLNSCFSVGDNNSGKDCYDHTDSSCPKGTIYNDLDLTTSIFVLFRVMAQLRASYRGVLFFQPKHQSLHLPLFWVPG